MRAHPSWSIVLLLLAGIVAPAAAQVVDRPPRVLGGLFGGQRPRDPNRTSQELTLTLNLGSGYDRNLGPGGQELPVGVFSPMESGFATTAGAAARYWRGRTSRYFEASGRGYLNSAHAADSRVAGGDAAVRGETGLGRRSGLTYDVGAAYEPTLLFSALGPLVGPTQGSVVPDGNAPQGILEQRWLSAQGSIGVYRHWTTRQRMDVLYTRSLREPVDGPGTDSRTQVASVRHRWNPRPNAGFQLSYRYDENQQTDEVLDLQPVRTQTVDAGVNVERRLSPTRGALFSFTGGAAYTRVRPIAAAGMLGQIATFVVPIVAATARLDLARAWNVSTAFDRSVTVLEGLSPEPFATNVVSLRLDGVVAQRTNVGISGAYSRGAALVTDAGSFEATGATAQVQYAMGRCCGVFTSYNYYTHRTTGVVTVPTGYPPRYDRHSVRVGFSFWLPLYGTF